MRGPGKHAARDRLAQLDVVGLSGALDRREAGHQRDVGVLGAIKNFLCRRSGPRRVAAVLVEMPADVRVDVDHARQDGQVSQVVRRVRRVSGFDRRDFGSLHDDGRIAERLAGAVEDGRRVDPDGLGSARQRRRQRAGAGETARSGAVDCMARIIILGHPTAMTETGSRRLSGARAPWLPASVVSRGEGVQRGQPCPREQDWPFYGGDQGGIEVFAAGRHQHRRTSSKLRVAWEWSPREKALEQFGTRPGNFQTTPLMIDNVLYLSTPYNRVVALNADTGAELWAFDPKAVRGRPAAERHRLRAPRRRRVARQRRRQQAAHLHQQPLPPDLHRRGHRPARRQLRHARRLRSEQGPRLGNQQDPLHEHVAADRLQGSGDSRQRRRRSAGRTATIRPATCARSTRARASRSGRSTPFRSRASSATTPGGTIRGASPATPTSGRR